MNLLAIRGRNLASLADPFAVDFTAEPLASAGLFAITGPTGAGKSTLLDAVCLALYDTFPRLAAASKTRFGAAAAGEEGAGRGVGREIAADDPRTILRRGAADGYAEVDFVGGDGRHYRARWEVRRARRSPAGRLQAQELCLRDLATGQALGGTKTETLAEIRRQVGLEMDQFRRSVLLAQGEFDAFLRAEPKDRSALLELMTGTGIYSEISRQAFARAKQEQQTLAELDRQRAAVEVLTPDALAELIARKAEAEQSERSCALEQKQREGDRDWYGKRRLLERGLEEASSALDQACRDQVDAAPKRATLERLRKARPVLLMVKDLDRLCGEIEGMTVETARAGIEAGAANSALATAKTEHERASIALTQAETAFKEAGPLLSRAADLDSRVEEARTSAESAEKDGRTAETVLADAETTERTARKARDQIVQAIADHEVWLKQHESRRLLAERWDEWLSDFPDLSDAHVRVDACDQAIAKAEADLTDLRQRLDVGRGQMASEDEGIAKLVQGVASLEDGLRAFDLTALNSSKDTAGAGLRTVQTLIGLADGATELLARERQLADRRKTATVQKAAAGEQIQALKPQQRTLQSWLDEARRSLPLAEAALDQAAETLRGLLVAGEPCPVCGAREHPAATAETPLTALARGHVENVKALEAELRSLAQAITDNQVALQTAERDVVQSEADAASLQREADRCRQSWSAAIRDLRKCSETLAIELPGLTDDPLAENADAALGELRASLDGLATATQAALTDLVRLQQERDTLRTRLDGLRDNRGRLAAEHETLQETAVLKQGELTTLEAERRAVGDTRRRLLERLRPPLRVLGDWEHRFPAGTDALIAECRALTSAWLDSTAALAASCEHVVQLDRDVTGTQAAAKSARTRLAETTAKCTQAAERLRQLIGARALLFEGRHTGEVRSGLNTERLQCQVALASAADAERESTGNAEAARARVQELTSRMERTEGERSRAKQACDAAAAETSVSADEARRLLAIESGWITEVEALLLALDAASAKAEAVAGERAVALQLHLLQSLPELSEEHVAQRLAELAPLIQEARQRIGGCQAQLAIDDQNRQTLKRLLQAIDRQLAALDRWKALSDLIGSQDGAKFRRFAQRLTLDRMLALANAQLQELTRRYVLQLVPDGELEIQVIDREMGDDVRSVASLSGGERFLASLALALGLAAMGSQRTRIETLFIDEGFGALDVESLEIAISALEALQAAGRKVGVISHVQAMVERIGVQIQVARQGGGRSNIHVCRI